jgi:hypothetical protein
MQNCESTIQYVKIRITSVWYEPFLLCLNFSLFCWFKTVETHNFV